MSASSPETTDLCSECVYYPPNLPENAYSAEDWVLLQCLNCSFEHTPGSSSCLLDRKNSCSLLDLGKMKLIRDVLAPIEN